MMTVALISTFLLGVVVGMIVGKILTERELADDMRCDDMRDY